MYRLILVDDEAIVRDGISKCISWEENGFELAGLCEHGAQALEYLRENPVDVVISDINMPRMDGLELSRHISNEFPRTMVLILTGYDDFEYAQEAITYHVREFLLKPITAEELEAVLVRIRKELDKRQESEHQQELMQEKLEQSFPLLRERFLYRLVSGRIDRDVIERRKHYFQWENVNGWYQVVLLGIPATWNELERLTLFEQIKKVIGNYDDVFADREENLAVLLQDMEKEALQNRAKEMAKHAFREVSRMEKDQISAGCGQAVDDVSILPRSYKGASNALDYSKVLGLSQIVFIDEVRKKQSISPESFNALTAELLEQLKEGGRGQTQNALNEIFTYMENHYLTMNEAAYYFIRMHSVLLYFLQEMDLVQDEDPLFTYSQKQFHSINDAHSSFSRIIRKIEQRIQERRHDMMLSRIDKARKIVGEQYNDPNFSLSDMCDQLYLSSSQFSVLFKEGTGQTFVEFLTAYRINEAKKLLKTTDLKGYEIAERTGYADPRYFSLIFKKHTKMTPMEYRRSLEK
ncbi:MAG: response regulator [Spirochaetales bacterium]|nr:response regulator [Spirochaetales bacterium]